ncbi:MAG TPA: hypothetical protein VND90_02515 [Terracidiphilus sp.]|nr:hypothetical protein [Terracidiphilus sp.]
MSGKVEIEETKVAAPEAAQAAETSRPDAEKPMETPEKPSAETSNQPRPRTRLIETPPTAHKKELDRLQPAPNEVKVLRPASPVLPLARTSHAEEPAPRYPGLERILGLARKVIPVVQKVLPLLEGNVPLTVANLLAPSLEAHKRPVDLHPLEADVDKLHAEQVELRTRLVEQTATIQHLAEQVEDMQAQADRNAREREEMAEDLRGLRRRVTWIAWIGFLLLAASLAANGVLLGRMLGLLH